MGVKKWIIRKYLSKAVKRGLVLLAAYLSSDTVSAQLLNFGVTLDTAQMTGTLWVLYEGLRNYLKTTGKASWL